MPNVTVYIRKDDMQMWRDLPDKSKAVSNMLELYFDKKRFYNDNEMADAPSIKEPVIIEDSQEYRG